MATDTKPIERALREAAREAMELARQLGVGSITVHASLDDDYADAIAWPIGSNGDGEPCAKFTKYSSEGLIA